MAMVSEDAVRARAYQLWEEGGRVDGDHEEHWRRAQAECGAVGDGSGDRGGSRDGLGAADALDEGATLAGTEGASMDSADVATPAGIDGAIAKPLVEAKSKPRRWPTPIIDV